MDNTELKLEFLGISGINPFVPNTSSPRMAMEFNHQTQHLPLLSPDEPVIVSGIEYELGKYINDVKAEHDCVVKAIIPKYREYGVTSPPICTLLVEREEDGQLVIDYINVDSYRSQHTYFGYKLTPTEVLQNLTYNSPINKDTILAQADSYGDEGIYMSGLNANVAFMSHPSVAEDGYVVSESFIERSKYLIVSKRIINITKDTIPLNTYGNDVEFKFLPEIGQAVSPDGLLCAVRPRNDWFSISDLCNTELRNIDVTFDDLTYVKPGSIVTDINIVRGNYNKPEFTSQMTAQLDQYAEMLNNYHRNIVSQFDKLMAEKKSLYGQNSEYVRLSPKLNRFITDTMIKLNTANGSKNKLSYRKLPIDQYRIEVTTVAVSKLDIGHKLADTHAAKGVICRIMPDAAMPVDENGVRVDVITDSMSTISRMNLGRAYQSILCAAARDNKQRLCQFFHKKHGDNYINQLDEVDYQYAKQYLTEFFSIINPDVAEFVSSLNGVNLYNYVLKCLTNHIKIWYPTDNKINITDVIRNLEASPYRPHIGKVSYVDEYGVRVTTKDDIRVGQLYFMVLEKVANTYSGVSSAKVNNFGFPVKGTNLDKHRYPHSLTPTKTLGETEIRILLSFMSPEAVADLIDLTGNLISHKLLIKHCLESEKAYDTNFDIDRETVAYGNTKSLMILKHIFNACGFDITKTGAAQ